MESCNHRLTEAEKNRNRHTECAVYWHDPAKDFEYSSSLPQIFPDIVRCHARYLDTHMRTRAHGFACLEVCSFQILMTGVIGLATFFSPGVFFCAFCFSCKLVADILSREVFIITASNICQLYVCLFVYLSNINRAMPC